MLSYETIKLKPKPNLVMAWREAADSLLIISLLTQKLRDIGSFLLALKFAVSKSSWESKDLLILDNGVLVLEKKINAFTTSLRDESVPLNAVKDEHRLRCLVFELPSTLKSIVNSFRLQNAQQFKLNLDLLEIMLYRISCCFQQDKAGNA